MSADLDEDRSPEGRVRAEKALVTLVHRLDNEDIPLIVLGGLLPEVLTQGHQASPAHLGTTDVDLLVAAHLDSSVEMAQLERALAATGFKPIPGQGGWRWRGTVDGIAMKLESGDAIGQERHRFEQAHGFKKPLILVAGIARTYRVD